MQSSRSKREARGRGSWRTTAHSCKQNCKAFAELEAKRMSNLPECKESLALWWLRVSFSSSPGFHLIAASGAAGAAAAITAPWNFNRANFTVCLPWLLFI